MKMTYKIKVVFLGLICSILLDVNIADGKSETSQKNPSSKTLRSMARVYMAYGEYMKAQPLAEKALALAKTKQVSDSELAMCLIDLATLYTYQGELDKAEEMCKKGLQIQKKILYKKHPHLAYTLRILSAIYYEQGEYSKSKSVLDDAFVIMTDNPVVDDEAMAPFSVDMARVLVAQGNLEQAESYYQKAMLSIDACYGPNHLYTANVLAGMAKLYTLQKRYAEAEELINRAIQVQEKIYGPDHHLIAASWLTKARICQEKGELIQAQNLVNKSLSAIEKSGNPTAFTKLQQEAKDILAGKHVVYGPVAQAVK
jgi:tetratricopeptide (TPR) repeat protein